MAFAIMARSNVRIVYVIKSHYSWSRMRIA